MKKSTRHKIRHHREIAGIAQKARREGKIIVTTNGCFDILHAGHLKSLEEAKSLGDVLIVGINSDASVRANKGPKRPINPAKDRALLLAGLSCVDHVFVFSSENPIPWIKKVKPHIHVKGDDRTPDQIVERATVEMHGGRIVLIKTIPGISTTHIIQKMERKGK